MLAYVGRQAISNEPKHIIKIEISIEFLRPCLSATRPKIQPPIGRIRNPAAKTPAVFTSCTVGLSDGKNAGAK
ncbi:hypothetical protein D3C73_882480 [compost metagenome]